MSVAGSGAKLSQAQIDALIAKASAPAPAPEVVAPTGPFRPQIHGEVLPGMAIQRDLVSRNFAGRIGGSVARVAGHEIEIRGLKLSVGDTISLTTSTGVRTAEVVALNAHGATALLYGESMGIGKSDPVYLNETGFSFAVSPAMLGRVLNAHGAPIDGKGPIYGEQITLENEIPNPLSRPRITDPLPMGVRLLDTLCTAGRGQRMGIFGGSGVGKSTLLGMMARGTAADINVVALVGERGREVREFLEDDLGPEGLARSIVVVATSDEPPLVRLRAGVMATRISEWFADAGSDVLLVLDSLTRLAMAQRDVGLAAGEPPTARGYTPSVFSMLPKLLERTGPRPNGSITAFYTVLVEGDDMNDPIADAARSILDGHIVLDRDLATQGRYPAIDPLSSLSRLASKVVPIEGQRSAERVRAALAAIEEVRDLVEVGAYVSGTNDLADKGLAAKEDLIAYLSQRSDEVSEFASSWDSLVALSQRVI